MEFDARDRRLTSVSRKSAGSALGSWYAGSSGSFPNENLTTENTNESTRDQICKGAKTCLLKFLVVALPLLLGVLTWIKSTARVPAAVSSFSECRNLMLQDCIQFTSRAH